MKTLVIGDTHFANHQAMGGPVVNGVNRRCRELVDTLVWLVKKTDAARVIQVGDFFDNAKPPPPVVDYVLERLSALDTEWHVLAGNHDIGSFSAPSAVAPLRHVKKFYVYEKIETVQFEFGTVCMIPYNELGALESFKTASAHNADIQVAHFALCGGPASFDYANSNDMLSLFRTNPLFCGHEHLADHHGPHMNIGSMSGLNFGADTGTHKYHVEIKESARGVRPWCIYRRTARGPRFVDVRTPVQLTRLLRELEGFSYYVRTTPALSKIVSGLVDAGVFAGFSVSELALEQKEQQPSAFSQTITSLDAAVYDHVRKQYGSGVAESVVSELRDIFIKVKV